jgi:hypothetical protein
MDQVMWRVNVVMMILSDFEPEIAGKTKKTVPLSTAMLSKLQPTGRMWPAVQFCPASGRYL